MNHFIGEIQAFSGLLPKRSPTKRSPINYRSVNRLELKTFNHNPYLNQLPVKLAGCYKVYAAEVREPFLWGNMSKDQVSERNYDTSISPVEVRMCVPLYFV
jgi:hypothetical protein